MPTGYTAALCDGTQSFREFVLDAAGAFVRPGMEVEVEEPSTFYLDLVVEEEARLAELLGWSQDQIEAEYAAARAKIEAANEERRIRQGEVIKRLVEMKAEVYKWTPPTDKHVSLKRFMLEQLTMTIDSEHPYKSSFEDIGAINWYDEKISGLKDRIKRHIHEHEQEEKRVADRNAWRAALLASL